MTFIKFRLSFTIDYFLSITSHKLVSQFLNYIEFDRLLKSTGNININNHNAEIYDFSRIERGRNFFLKKIEAKNEE